MTKRFVLGWLLMLVSCLPMIAQIQDPIKFKTEWKSISENEAEIIFQATLDEGWHVSRARNESDGLYGQAGPGL